METKAVPTGELIGLIPNEEMPERYGNSPSFWNKARVAGEGPEFIKLGRRVYYAPSAVEKWLATKRRTSTSDPGTR
jgi:hypothetical protein